MSEDNRLTVHVLDTARGAPAAGLSFVLSYEGGEVGRHVTNHDGRCDAPLLAGDALRAGSYEIVFQVGAWRTGEGDPGFYERVAIQFTLRESPGHVHIPLLLSPYGYSTYRGS